MTAAGLSDLVVEVLHWRDDDNHPYWSVGSGFFVGSRLVLTASHNVDGPGESLVRVHGTEERPAVVRLQGNEDIVDLAVLEVSDITVDVPPLRYGEVDRSAPAVVERCWAIGFPFFKERAHDPKPLRLSAQVNGEIPTGENLNQQLLTLQVRSSPRPLPSGSVRESEWAGMSGATVFSGDNIIVGVITEHHLPEGESALTVVPITALDLLSEAEATKWWKLLGVDHQALVRLPDQDVLNRFGFTYKLIEPHIQARVPFMVEDLPADYVPRLQVYKALIDKLLDQRREKAIAITVAMRGAGGYGKTTMAKALCHDERIQQEFDDGILWVTLGEHPGNLVAKVEDLIYILNKERPGLTGIDAAGARLAELLADRDILLVIDDVWDGIHLKPFLHGGNRCVRLITTRNEDVFPVNAKSQVVDAMEWDEAVQLLSFGLQTGAFTATNMQALRALVARLGKWALLLKLANGVLRDRVSRGEAIANALVHLNKALDRRGLTAFDAENAQARDAAVSATLRVSFDLLQYEQYAHYQELAVFPEDVDIPLATLQKLWGVTGGLDDFDTEELCRMLNRYSLLLTFNLAQRTIRLHDVIRSYLQKAVGDGLPALHTHLLDAYALTRWAGLPDDEPYLWDYLAYHLVAAGRLEELVATVKDLRYLANKTLVRIAYAAEDDMAATEQRVPSDVPLRLLKRSFANMGHLLNRCSTFNDLAAVLSSRLVHLQELMDLCQAFEQDIPRPYLTSWHLLPDLPDPALIRTLSGHTRWVLGCTISPVEETIVSASDDHTLKIWNARTGEERRTLHGHTNAVNGCAISPAGDYIVSASGDQTLKVWDARTGEEQRTLHGHTDWVNRCAISPGGDYIVSASGDQTLKVWDARTGEQRRTLHGHTSWVLGCAISPEGDYIVSVSKDQTLKVWDARTGACLSTLFVNGQPDVCAVHPDGEHIVAVGSGGIYFLRWVR